MNFELVTLGLVWLVYFCVHSLLASVRFKGWFRQRWPSLTRYYRLGYNGLAIVLAIPPIYLLWLAQGPYLWAWTGYLGWLMNGIALVALLGFVISLKSYDGMDFLGLRQLTSDAEADEFALSAFHRYVRHPWYFFALAIIWSRDIDPAMLLTACEFSLYFAVGSYLEESKLIEVHGEIYRQYRRLVPGLIPLPWRFLSRKQARDLLNEYTPDTQDDG